jgi:hypothetical protein
MTRRAGWVLLIAANVLFCGVLSFYRASGAAPPVVKPPFANPVEQRMEMVNQLREIKELLKEQNALLRSGTLKVVVSDSKQP